MWILNGNNTALVNVEKLNRIFIYDTGDNVLLGGDFGADSSDGKVACLGKYRKHDTATEELVEIAHAIDSDVKLYYMPVNEYDIPTEQKIHDSRVKRRGGS